MNHESPVERCRLGDSDLVVSKVCLGTMTWGRQNSRAEGIEQLRVATEEYGLNFIDTAEMYPVPTEAETQGETDRTIADWLRQGGPVRREDIILATKVAGQSDRITWLRDHGRGTRVTRAEIMESVEKSLSRLNTDYIDLLQIHWPDRYVPLFGAGDYDLALEREAESFEAQLAAFKELIDSGKVRYLGVSNETPFGVCSFCELAKREPLPKIVSIQNSYSLIVRSEFEGGLTEVCSPTNHNVGLLAYSPLAGGILSGKYRDPASVPKNARLKLFPGFMDRYLGSLAKDAVEEYAAIAEAHGLTLTQLALSWCYNRPIVASTIIGATSVPQLRENIEAWSLPALPQSAHDDISRVYRRYRDPSKSEN